MRHLTTALAITGLVYLWLTVCGPSTAIAGTAYDFELVADGARIARHGIQTANPSIIRVPDWIPSGQRPNASANYYMYYGVHREHYIRMKWAETLDGPWSAFDLGGSYNSHTRHGVFDPDSDSTRDTYTHVFAPDVHVDDENERIIMYYHGENEAAPKLHSNFVATSEYGLNFNSPTYAGGETGHGPVSVTHNSVTREVPLGEDYQHIFEYNGDFYSVAKRGILDKAPDPNDPWAPHPSDPLGTEAWTRDTTPSALWTNDANPGGQGSYISPAATFLASSEFANHPNNPLPGQRIFSDSHDDGLRINHTAVNLLPAKEQLEVFFYVRANYASSLTAVYDSTYRIVYDISDPDFENWTVATDGGEYMFDVVVTDDEIRAAVEAAHPGGVDPDLYADPSALGAPGILVDDDGSKYLFYTYLSVANGGNPRANEGQISALRLFANGTRWEGGTGDWTDTNWNGPTTSVAPVSDDHMVIDAASSAVTVAADFVDGGSGPARSLIVGQNNTASLTINSGVTLEVTDVATIGDSGTLATEIQGSDSGLLDVGGDLTMTGAEIQLDWLEGALVASKFGGAYTIATATGSLTGTPTVNTAGNIGSDYVDTVTNTAGALTVTLHDLGDGDTNIDGVVDSLDLSDFGQGWGSSSPAWADGDFNFDGVVDSLDLSAFGQAWGWSAGSAGATAGTSSPVPEPGTIVMLLIGAAGVLLYRKRR